MKKSVIALFLAFLSFCICHGADKRSDNSANWKGCYDDISPEEVFLDIEGEKLFWGEVREQVAIKIAAMPRPMSMAGDEFNEEMNYRYQRAITDLLQKYILNAVTAHCAVREGLSVTREEVMAEVSQLSRRGFDKLSPQGKRQLEFLKDEQSLVYRDIRNNLLTRKYARAVLLPKLVVASNQVKVVIFNRHKYNSEVNASNVFYRAEMKRIHSEIMGKKISFAEAAREYSECGSSADDGYYGEVDPGQMPSELEAVFSHLKPGEISDVVETPYSFHIVKMLKANLPEGEGQKSWEIAHIMIEKLFLKEEYSEESAADLVRSRMLRDAVRKRQMELVVKTKIDSKIPLFDTKEFKRPTQIIK